MELRSRDFFFSLIVHLGLLFAVTLVNPFTVRTGLDFDAVGVNIITLPPLGDPALIKGGDIPEVAIPQAIIEEEVTIPIATPESKTEKYEIEKPQEKETPKPKPEPRRDTGYRGDARKGDQQRAGGADVSDQVGAGSIFGTVSVDNASFNYPYYFVQAFGKIQRNWSNPVHANQTISCIVFFQILRSGTILDPTVRKSSGIEAFDRACLRALAASDPLPPLPSDFKDDIIGINLEFPYEPR